MGGISSNIGLFKCWTPETAYILGLFCADGSMYKNVRGSCFVAFEMVDKNLLENIKLLMGLNIKLSKRKRNKNWQTAWRLQIGSKSLFNELLALGIKPKKAHRLQMPSVPDKFIMDFIRGYFDGDGNVQFGLYKRQGRLKKSPVLLTRFISGSRGMLNDIPCKLHKNADIKMKQAHYNSNAWRLDYSAKDSVRLYNYIYKKDTSIFLERKKEIFEKYLQLMDS